MLPEDYFDGLKGEDEKVKNLTTKLNHLLENCLHNMDVKDMEAISSRMKGLLDQGSFWLKSENFDRFIYDLQDFINWLIEFIADKEREFWDE